MSELRPLLRAEEISAIVNELAEEIGKDYTGKTPVLIGLLKGAFIFMADLARALEMDLEVEFIQPSSYRAGTKASSEDVVFIHSLKGDVGGRHVLIIDGIVDRGATLRKVVKEIEGLGAASIKVCSLLVRKDVKHDVTVDYTGRSIPAGFVVGYGMDMGGRYRQLKDVYILKEKHREKI
ncbi:MAG: hypoxanthine phosphoribosyltransferase [Thermodesulfobacteriota bacterium]